MRSLTGLVSVVIHGLLRSDVNNTNIGTSASYPKPYFSPPKAWCASVELKSAPLAPFAIAPQGLVIPCEPLRE